MTSAPVAEEAEFSVATERKPGSTVELKIVAPAGEVDTAVEAAVRRLAGRVNLPGFRRGKAPASLVERAVGWPALRQEAIESALPGILRRAMASAKVEAVTEPQLTDIEFERGEPLRCTATATVRPEVELGDYLAMRLERPHTEVDDARVEEALTEVRRRRAELVDVTDRPVQSGDVLRATLLMRREGEAVGGEEGERDLEVDRERLLPGLADALLGLNVGESHTVEITLPDDYARPELRGVAVAVEARVHKIRERALPELDDALAVAEGSADLAGLTEKLRTTLVEQADRSDAQNHEEAVLARLLELVSVDVPQVMVDAEIDRQLRQMAAQLAQVGLAFDRYLEYSGQTIEALREQYTEGATRQVRLQLTLETLAEAEGLEVDEAAVEREVEEHRGTRKLSHRQLHELQDAARQDLRLRAAAQRAIEIAQGEV